MLGGWLMAENSRIEWTDHTFNPWVGCTKISPACDHCYAESWAKRTGSPYLWQGERRRTTASNWLQPVRWNRGAVLAGVRRKVFCASLADVFDNQVPASWRDDLWRLIEQTPHLDWLLLTKRPQNIAKMLPDPLVGARAWGNGWPNVWLGTTIEDRKRAATNLAALGAVPSAVRFVSAEPLLEDWSDMLPPSWHGPVIHWLICGGESGGRARDMPEAWAAAFRDRCAAAGIRFFMKQMTRKAPIPDSLLVRQFPVVA